jgi:hypothetical protein
MEGGSAAGGNPGFWGLQIAGARACGAEEIGTGWGGALLVPVRSDGHGRRAKFVMIECIATRQTVYTPL